ncbi:MAG: bifunctional proline dehydrogenase/L-glutamate gamma-semialdehyde dehydrogenase PutA [Pseudomonadota bacterium]
MDHRRATRELTFAEEGACLSQLEEMADLSEVARARIAARGAALVRDIRDGSNPSLMELFLEEYGLSTDEGVALMCLAEALLRVPDAATIDDLIEDKIVPSAWSAHLGQSHSPLINASTWALMLTGRVLDDSGAGVTAALRGAVKRLGEPVIRSAVGRAMREMGSQFVLGETIGAAMTRAAGMEQKGFTYSYDMLGEAARTEADARRYHMAYADAIAEIAGAAGSKDIAANPGISIKLSALHPRYEPLQAARVMEELVPRVLSLASLAKSAGIGLNVDAEEAARLELSLDVIDKVLSDPALAGWDGFGVVVQAYSKRAPAVIDWLYARAEALDRHIMVRLVKGAYWDSEVKLAQVEGWPGFPVYTQKSATDVAYIACARKLLTMGDRIYPQFATHNAHSVAAVLEMAPEGVAYEFQRLHGMGESLHTRVMEQAGTHCRIYAPVGAHRDLLAYLVRRLLENGANSSFVNQIVDDDVPPEAVAADPFAALATGNDAVTAPAQLFAPERRNSAGFFLGDQTGLKDLMAQIDAARSRRVLGSGEPVLNPSTGAEMGRIAFLDAEGAAAVADRVTRWDAPVAARSEALERAAVLYEEAAPELYALLMDEAGKTLVDCIGEVREAVDFLRYYAAQARGLSGKARGNFVCISPWNFPLAIFTGQIAAALATGNGVIAKPAETTSLIAARAVELLHGAGVPTTSLALVPGFGHDVGPALCRHPKTSGVCFTGSTATGQAINRELAAHQRPGTPLIAETGGINAMIVDSTALPEQAVRDIVASAFQSAGQRCSALRVLYVQEDIAESLTDMLFGAMDALSIGDPSDPSTDIGPVIDAKAKSRIENYVAQARAEGRVLKELKAPEVGTFVAPVALSVSGIEEVTEEVFGPVLHIATFKAAELDRVIDDINRTGYGLTFGLHTRIDSRVQHIIDRVNVGNIYVNRNQIGAVVGSQPFGGHGLSGTGPKAGGPRYLHAFVENTGTAAIPEAWHLPGPTGEENTYSTHPRHGIFCAGPGAELAREQATLARDLGCTGIIEAPDATPVDIPEEVSAVIRWGDAGRDWALACAERAGPIIPLVTSRELSRSLTLEKSVCIDTTASGGNAELLAASSKVDLAAE